MTDREINQAIADVCPPKFVGLRKGGLWYLPGYAGYTAYEKDAGRYTPEEAKKHAYAHGAPSEWVYVTPFKTPNYCEDLNAMYEAEATLDKTLWSAYAMELRRIVKRDCDSEEFYLVGCEVAQCIADFWFYHATARQRAEAFLRTAGKWMVSYDKDIKPT